MLNEISCPVRGSERETVAVSPPPDPFLNVIHKDSDFKPQVQALLSLAEDSLTWVAAATATWNDLHLFVTPDMAETLDLVGCEDQRQFVLLIQQRWAEFAEVPAAGAGVSIKSPTGRVLARADDGIFGIDFHCN